MIKGEG